MKLSFLNKFTVSIFSIFFFLPVYSAKANFLDDSSKVIVQDVYNGSEFVGQVTLPNWDVISFSDFPPTLQGGFIGTEYNSFVDYDLSRSWSAGDMVTSFMKLGDFQEAFGIQDLHVDDILSSVGFDADQVPLSSFDLVADQTLEELVLAIPSLGSKQVSEVEPVADLLVSEGYSLDSLTFDALVSFNSPVSELKLEEIDLSGYTVDDIPGLENAELDDFTRWENAYLDDVALLSEVPLSQMPNPLSNIALPVMRIDQVFGAAEAARTNTVSGSYEEKFNVPCDSQCPYIELDDLENSGSGNRLFTEGKQWISGRDPVNANFCPDRPWGVNGGHGILGNMNCGKEPTGRHPFGKVFKMAVWNTDETTDRIETAIFFRFCLKTPFVDLGCTPFFIGAVPFFGFSRDDWIFLGI